MSHFSEDTGTDMKYIQICILNPDKSNMILMEKVNAVVYLSTDEKILISSKKANIMKVTMIHHLVVR